MKSFKFRRKNININYSDFFKYFFSILLSSLILALVLISLPLTERVTSSAKYDLVNKSDKYWAKEYTVELDTKNSIRIEEDIEKVRSILQRRLRAYSVEQSTVTRHSQDDIQYLKIKVQSSVDQTRVDTLVKTPSIVKIVTKKVDFNYEDPDNPLAPYLEKNYDITEFNRDSFRNVYVTQLKNSENQYSYFALFKTWSWEKEWRNFLTKYAGQTVGVSIDQFVTPVQIPLDQNLFAVSASVTENEDAKIVSILYNSGHMPLSYSVTQEENVSPDIAEIDYIKLTEGILIAVILIYLYLLLVEKTTKSTLLLAGLSTVITVSFWIAYLKISSTPTDIFLLALEIVTIIAFIRIIAENKESKMIVTILLSLITALSIILGSGYIRMYAYDILILILLSNISIYISEMYISNVTKALKT